MRANTRRRRDGIHEIVRRGRLERLRPTLDAILGTWVFAVPAAGILFTVYIEAPPWGPRLTVAAVALLGVVVAYRLARRPAAPATTSKVIPFVRALCADDARADAASEGERLDAAGSDAVPRSPGALVTPAT